MPDRWEFRSHTYDNCNCDMNCGCQFNLPSTHGFCQTAYIGTVEYGHFNDTPLTGLKWAGLWKWPGEVAAGGGTRQIIVDERADDAQRAALETIISGGACAPLSNVFAVYGAMCDTFLDTLFLPIELEVDFDERRATAHIPGILTSRGQSLVNEFTGEPFHVALARPSGSMEFEYAELGLASTKVTGGMDMEFEDSYGMWCVHHFNENGLVRTS